MQFSQTSIATEDVRQISTTNLEEMEIFHNNRNRRYTQIQAGEFSSQCIEVNLDGVHIFREKISVGARIEAAPASAILPFAAVLPSSGALNFCGRESEGKDLMQATGGQWDINYRDTLDYVCAAFHRDALFQNVERILGHTPPEAWLISQARLTDPHALQSFGLGLTSMMHAIAQNPDVFTHASSKRMLGAQVLSVTLRVLVPTLEFKPVDRSPSRRRQGVHRVIEYLHAHASSLPTIPELCAIANLSERSLEYGFREFLNVTPVRYLKLIRLNGAQRDLMKADPSATRVADIALKWGFFEFGRFSKDYRTFFGELPSVTLRRSH